LEGIRLRDDPKRKTELEGILLRDVPKEYDVRLDRDEKGFSEEGQ